MSAEVVILNNGSLTPQQLLAKALGQVDDIQHIVLVQVAKGGGTSISWSDMVMKDLAWASVALQDALHDEISKL